MLRNGGLIETGQLKYIVIEQATIEPQFRRKTLNPNCKTITRIFIFLISISIYEYVHSLLAQNLCKYI